jgi:lysozyme
MKNIRIDRKLGLILFGCSIAAIIVGGGLLFYNGTIFAHNPDRQKFPIRGIDISNFQANIDWNRIDPVEVNFVLMKATEGGDFKDKMFNSNWQNVRSRKLVTGAYHFFTFCKSGQEQAKNYMDSVPIAAHTLPPVIDLEFAGNCKSVPTRSGLEKELNTFIDLVQQKYRKRPILYVTHEFYDAYLRDRYPNSPIWISDFYSFDKLPVLSDRKLWLFWQYSERGRVTGVNSPVDLDVFNGNRDEFDRLVNSEITRSIK